MNLFQILNVALIGLLGVLCLWYLWDLFFHGINLPPSWNFAREHGAVSKKILSIQRLYRDKNRFFNWWIQVERLKKESVAGDFAELGVYKGQSARVLHHMDPDRVFHLFDTFTGFPGVDLVQEKGEAATYSTANFADTSPDLVLKNIGGNGNIVLHPGHFPETATDVAGRTFALVNMDADLYQPTRAGLEFFYHRLSPGGVIFIHDYNPKWEGIIKAVDEFCAQIPEAMILLTDREGTVMIIRNRC